MKIRKQVYELTLDDLAKYPVWTYASGEERAEGQDEATVKPVKVTGEVDPSLGTCIVRATFTLADETRMTGLVSPPYSDNEDLGEIQPVIVTERGQVAFWCGAYTPSKSQIKESYSKLGRKAREAFPIHVVSDLDSTSGPIHALIPGFMVLVDWKAGTMKVVK